MHNVPLTLVHMLQACVAIFRSAFDGVFGDFDRLLENLPAVVFLHTATPLAIGICGNVGTNAWACGPG